MKINCGKCNKILTQDLYPISLKTDKHGRLTKETLDKVFEVIPEYVFDYENMVETNEVEYYKHDHMRKGIFFVRKGTKHKNWTYEDSGIKGYYKVIKPEPKKIVVSGKSFLEGVIPVFKSGNECCDWSMGQELCCSCGNFLGEMYLDCYEDGCVDLINKNVRRNYD